MSPAARTEETNVTATLVGREREMDAIEARLDAVGERGVSVLIRGEAGVGKSVLLTAAHNHAESAGMRVLAVSGTRAEARVPFAVLHQLLRPLLERAKGLARPQCDALLATFGVDGVSAPDPFLVALGSLELVAAAAREAPLLVIVDDAQWLDASTTDVLGFIARRLDPEPVVLLIAERDGYETGLVEFGLPELRVEALDDQSSRALLDSHPPALGPELRGQVLMAAAGNPLALVELAVAAGSRSHIAFGVPEQLPMTPRLQQALGDRYSHLPTATRTVLLIASADHEASLSDVLTAAALIEKEPPVLEDLAPAVASALVEHDDWRIRFRHRLVAAAVYQAATSAQRHAAHAALATALVDEQRRRAWHRAASTTSPDEAIAAELERASLGATTRGAHHPRRDGAGRRAHTGPLPPTTPAATGSRARRRARQPASGKRDPRHDRSVRLQRARRSADRAPAGHDRAWLPASTQGSRPDDRGSHPRSLVERDRSRAATAPGRGHALVVGGSRPRRRPPDRGGGRADRGTRGRSPRRCRSAGSSTRPPVQRSVTSPLAPHPTAATRTPRTHSEPRSTPRERSRSRPRSSGRPWPAFETQGRLWLLPQALAQQAWNAIYTSNWCVATSAAEEAATLARDTRQPMWEAAARTALSMIAAIRGDTADAESLLREAEGIALPLGATRFSLTSSWHAPYSPSATDATTKPSSISSARSNPPIPPTIRFGVSGGSASTQRRRCAPAMSTKRAHGWPSPSASVSWPRPPGCKSGFSTLGPCSPMRTAPRPTSTQPSPPI